MTTVLTGQENWEASAGVACPLCRQETLQLVPLPNGRRACRTCAKGTPVLEFGVDLSDEDLAREAQRREFRRRPVRLSGSGFRLAKR